MLVAMVPKIAVSSVRDSWPRRRANEEKNQRFRKGVGGQRGFAQGNPSHAIDSGPVFPMPPYE